MVIAKILDLQARDDKYMIWALIKENAYKTMSGSYILVLRLIFSYSKIFRNKKIDISAKDIT